MTAKDLIAWRGSFKRPRAKSMTGRKPAGISQLQAATKLGISLRQYSDYETGKAKIPRLVELLTSARFRHGKGV